MVAWGEGKDGQKGGMGHWETFGVDLYVNYLHPRDDSLQIHMSK